MFLYIQLNPCYLKRKPFILYGADTCMEGTRTGVESTRRENTAAEFILKNRSSISYLLLGAGKRPRKPHYPPLKIVVKSRLEKVFPTLPIIMAEEDGWGIFKETLVMYHELQKRDETEIYVCSSWYQIPRILLMWRIIAGRSITIHVVASPSPRFQCLATELLSLGKVFIDWSIWKWSS
jgi:hypothetical protein